MIHVIRRDVAISKMREDGSRARYYLARDIEIIRAVMPPGCESDWHTHKVVTEVIYVFIGNVHAETETNGEVLSSGDVCAFPPGVKHRLVNRDVEPAFIFAVKFVSDGVDHTRDFQTDKGNGRAFVEEPWRVFFSRGDGQ